MATVKLDPAKGVQIPNLTTTERNAISSPETGALIWNTTTSAINQYNGSAWEATDTNTQADITGKLNLSGGTMTGTIAGFTSTGIDDNADATAITIDASENVGIGHPLNVHTQKLVVKQNAAITSMGAGGGINIVNEQGAGNFANLRFTGANQNAYLGYRDGTNDQDRRFSIGVGADAEHFSFSQNGLKFNGDTAAANGLDDYEEGTWTPTTNIGYSATNAHYVKIGNIVHITMDASTNAGPGDNSQATSVSGLPYSASPGDQISGSTFITGLNQNLYLEIGGSGFTIRDNANNTSITRGEYGSAVHRCSATYLTS